MFVIQICQAIYYALIIPILIFEFYVLLNPKKSIIYFKSIGENHYKDLDENQKEMIFFENIYLFWVVAGLFTSQWILFIFIFLFSFIPKRIVIITFLDSFITILLLGFIIINRFHLHYSMNDIISWVIQKH